jgi:hypothetical protein
MAMLKRKNVHKLAGGCLYVVGIWDPSKHDFEPLTASQIEVLEKNMIRTHRSDLRTFPCKNTASRMAHRLFGYSSIRVASILDIRK